MVLLLSKVFRFCYQGSAGSRKPREIRNLSGWLSLSLRRRRRLSLSLPRYYYKSALLQM